MKNAALKEDPSDVAIGYVDSLFCLAIYRNSVSPKFWLCRTTIPHRYSSDLDYATIQRKLLKVKSQRKGIPEA